jgi:hypothetical protein
MCKNCVALLKVPDAVMAAYESQSEEEEMVEICGTLRCLRPVYNGDTVAGAWWCDGGLLNSV